MNCVWCEATNVTETTKDCYWIMPDGKSAIEVLQIPAFSCSYCGSYISDQLNHEIDMALYSRELPIGQRNISYEDLMKAPYKRIDFK